MARPTSVVIDLPALSHNAAILRKIARSRRLMAVVKANAYGHGIIPCAKTLSPSVDALAVAFLDEAQTLRESGVDKPILVLEGPLAEDEIDAFLRWQLWPVIHRGEQLQWFERGHKPPAAIWLKVDTGMHRLGIDIASADTMIERAQRLCPEGVTLMSHLATAGDLSDPIAQKQLARWQRLTMDRDLPTSLLNSASALQSGADESHWLRPGYLFYGCHPDGLGYDLDLRPVMQLESEVIAVRDIARGETVGYGGRWRAERDSRIATIPVGYGDGYPRAAIDGTPVKVGDQIVPLAGRVSMDMITVDVTDHPDLTIGAPVVLWGNSPSVDAVADAAGTIGYELTSQVTGRVPRRELM
jgi:alanine racemase